MLRRPLQHFFGASCRSKLRINRGRRNYGNEILWQCSWRSSVELSGPFCLETPYFHVGFPHIVPNCSCEDERSFEHCHSQSFKTLFWFLNQGISTENMAHGPKIYVIRTPPPFMPDESFFFWGGEGGLQFVDTKIDPPGMSHRQ